MESTTQNDSVLYTTDNAGSLKAFNLLNVSDAFATSRISGSSESYYFYTEDQRGSTINVLDSSANRVVSYQYTDFGEVSETKTSGYSDFVNEIQYTGAIYDELTGLLYLNARFYDPSTGRFITQDSYRGEKNDEDTWHLYAYCANNPINYVDPTGHVWETVIDVAFLGMSINDFRKAPSTENFIYVVWDGVATILPFVVGSYIVKGAKVLAKTDVTTELTKIGLANRISDETKTVARKVKIDFSKVNNTSRLSKVENAVKTTAKLKTGNIPSGVVRVAKKLSPEAKKGYETAINGLKTGNLSGLNDHALQGNLKGLRAVDVKGTGKGRGSGRIIYEIRKGEINIKALDLDHSYKLKK